MAALALGVTQAKLDLRVIAQQVATEVPDYLYSYFWVRAAEVHAVDDLRGKVIAVPGLGGNPDVAAKMIMRAHKMTPPNDYQLVELPFTAMIPALQLKRIDAGILVPPFNVMVENDKTLKPLFSVHDAMGPVETVFWMAKADYVAEHRAILVDFLEDNIRMRRWMFDPKTRDVAIKMLSDFTKIPVSDYSSWISHTRTTITRPTHSRTSRSCRTMWTSCTSRVWFPARWTSPPMSTCRSPRRRRPG